MLSVEEAREHVLGNTRALDPTEVALDDAWGLVAADDIIAGGSLPRFDNSAMDGYAIRSADVADAARSHPVELVVAGEVRATEGPVSSLDAGQAIRIATGAALPLDADAIVPVEQTEETGNIVSIFTAAVAGQHIRRAGEDMLPGDAAVSKGAELGAGELALLAALGHDRVWVRPRPKVALLVTGDELVQPSAHAGPGEIYDSNSTALRALVREAGGEAVLLERVPDTDTDTIAALDRAGTLGDIIVSCGGVSMGLHDRVKVAVERLGTIDHWRVAMQPGKPVVIGRVNGVLFLGLPGNPVSVHVTFEQFVRPALRKMSGHEGLLRPRVLACLTEPLPASRGRRRFVRVRLSSDDGKEWRATPTGPQGSHIQSSLVGCHGVAVVPENDGGAEAGTWLTIEVWRLPER